MRREGAECGGGGGGGVGYVGDTVRIEWGTVVYSKGT